MINWKEIPFIRLLLPLIAGILAGQFFGPTFTGLEYFLGFGVFLSGFVLFKTLSFQWAPVYGGLIYVIIFFTGYQLLLSKNQSLHPTHFKNHIQNKGNFFSGVVIKTTKRPKTIQCDLAIEHLGQNTDLLKSVCGKIQVTLPLDTGSIHLKYGDKILLFSKIKEISPPKNPSTFDFKKYSNNQNIYHSAYIKESKHWQKISEGHGWWFLRTAYHSRQYFLNILKKHLGDTPEFAVGSALILGDKSQLDNTLKMAYANTGAMHVLAVSGLHVGIISWLFLLLLGRIKSKQLYAKWIKLLAMLFLIWSFVLITGASPSVLRAGLMFSLVFGGILFNKNTNIFNTLAASAFLLLCYDPYLLFQVGFQLSYLAVFSIVFFQPYIYKLWYIENPVGNWAWKLTAVSIAAQIGTFPISLFYFNQFPVYFFISGLIVIPAATLILSLGLGLFIASWIPGVEYVLGKLLYFTIFTMNSFIFNLSQVPKAVIENIWISGGIVLLLYLSILFFAFSLPQKHKKVFWISLILLLGAISWHVLNSYQNYHLKHITFYYNYKTPIIDFKSHKEVICLSPHPPKHSIVENWRSKNGIKEVYSLDSNENFTNNNFIKKGRFIQFYDKKLILVDSLLPQPPQKVIEVDFVYLTGNNRVTIEEVPLHFKSGKILFAADNPFWEVEKWDKKCRELGLDCYDISKGAFIDDLQ